jgi:hypothetical protein
MTRRTRTVRYGACIVAVLAGIACGAIIPGSAGGTAATVLVGIGLVGVISLVFYEVGLTEDRDRAARPGTPEGAESAAQPGTPEGDEGTAQPETPDGDERSPHDPGAADEHQGGRMRPLERRRGQRRRLR